MKKIKSNQFLNIDMKWVFIKRIIDVFLSLPLLILLTPVIMFSAVAIYCESTGNPFFTQLRVGKNGKLFTIYKIRSLYIQHFGIFPDQEEPHSYRITPIGKYLRRSKIDELPQLLNILLGDMSFVGPRPFVQYQFDFDKNARKNRVLVKPGLTGLAQVSGGTKLGKENIVWMDIWYINNFSLVLDVKILFATIVAIIRGEESYYDPFDLHKYLPQRNEELT